VPAELVAAIEKQGDAPERAIHPGAGVRFAAVCWHRAHRRGHALCAPEPAPAIDDEAGRERDAEDLPPEALGVGVDPLRQGDLFFRGQRLDGTDLAKVRPQHLEGVVLDDPLALLCRVLGLGAGEIDLLLQHHRLRVISGPPWFLLSAQPGRRERCPPGGRLPMETGASI
jgi:hypothetical protein